MSRLILTLLLCLTGSVAHAAVIARVHKDQDKILVDLTPVEVATLEEGQSVVMDIGAKPHFVIIGKIIKLNLLKKTAVIEVEDEEPRFEDKLSVRFLSTLWNAENSPIIGSYAQYHQYTRSAVEAAIGTFLEGTQEKYAGTSGFTQAWGTRERASGYLLFSPNLFGAGLGIERRDAKYLARSATDASVDITYFAVQPGFWLEPADNTRVSVRYDFSQYQYTYRNTGAQSLNYTFGQPEIGLLHYDADGEYGINYLSARESDDKYNQAVSGATPITVKTAMKLPAELSAYVRHIESPTLILGAGLGYIFFERSLGEDQPLRAKAYLPELLRLHGSAETRLNNGDKIDYVLAYDGGRALGLSTLEQRANMGSLSVTYQAAFGDKIEVGGTATAALGYISQSTNTTDPTTGAQTPTTLRVIGYRASVMAFARYEFDLLAKKRRPLL